VNDRSAGGIIEQQVGTELPATTNPSNPIPPVREKVLEQSLELSARHRIDGLHTRTLIRIALFLSSTTKSAHPGDDQRNNT
jgi:hypothetical protein